MLVLMHLWIIKNGETLLSPSVKKLTLRNQKYLIH